MRGCQERRCWSKKRGDQRENKSEYEMIEEREKEEWEIGFVVRAIIRRKNIRRGNECNFRINPALPPARVRHWNKIKEVYPISREISITNSRENDRDCMYRSVLSRKLVFHLVRYYNVIRHTIIPHAPLSLYLFDVFNIIS